MDRLRSLPWFVAGGCADYVVPWHEGAEMVAMLRRCGVPTRPLAYQAADHSSFIMDWVPLPQRSAPFLRRYPAALAGTEWEARQLQITLGVQDWLHDVVHIAHTAPAIASPSQSVRSTAVQLEAVALKGQHVHSRL
jgi:hypothetical protein